MSELKGLLKQAREAINDKKYDEVQEICKSILKKDKQNYMALLFLGIALQDAEQAPLAFKKAISIDKTKLLAWQGLISFYEKRNMAVDLENIYAIYEEMLEVELDNEKSEEIMRKINQIGKTSNIAKAIDLINKYLSKNESLQNVGTNLIADLLKCDVRSCNFQKELLPVIENTVSKNCKDEIIVLNYVTVLKNHLSNKDVVSTLTNSKKVELTTPVIKLLVECLFDEFNKTFDCSLITDMHNLAKGLENSYHYKLYEGVSHFANKLYPEAYKTLINEVNFQNVKCSLVRFLVKCCEKMNRWDLLLRLLKNVTNKIEDLQEKKELERILFVAYYNQEFYVEAANIFKNFSPEEISESDLIMVAHSLIEIDESYSEVLDRINDNTYCIPLKAYALLKQSKINEALELLRTSESDYFLSWLAYGIAYWEMKDFELSLTPLLKAAKANPCNSQSFMYLGHYYNYKGQIEKAKKCYLKAYNLNGNAIAAQHLSKIYHIVGDHQSNYELLTSLSKQLGNKEHWPYLQLGLHFLSMRQWDDAIIQLRNVIRINPDGSEVWESLADAYFARGAYTSAMKCYKKVISLDGNKNSYALTQLAAIQNLLLEYADAIKTYENVLMLDTSSVISLKGLADTWLNVAIEKYTLNLYGTTQSCAQKCIIYVTEALKINADYLCLWRKLGDAISLISKLPEKYSYSYIDNILFGSSDEGLAYQTKKDLISFAIACYSKCINIQPDPSLFYELSVSYLNYYLFTKDEMYCQKSLKAAQQCVKMRKSEWQYWNLLGILYMLPCFNKLDIAQHCLIKAILCDQTNANCWSNLGVLYLKLRQFVLANNSFKRAQQSDPNFVQSWIGQAIIAENVQEDEAMDLFRHAAQLSYHRESAFGYGDWVCKTLQKSLDKNNMKFQYAIENMHAVPLALDFMVWLCENEPKNTCAMTIKGILQERMGLKTSAFNTFELVCDLQEPEPNDAVLTNMGRMFLRHQNYEAAVHFFKNVKEGTLESLCGLALGYHRVGDYDECYSTYNAALHYLANNNQEKADLFVAMASMVYSLQNPDDAKTLLFQGIQVCPQKPTPHTLFATCAFGLLQSDVNLSQLAISEMKHYNLDASQCFNVGYLKSYLFYQEENVNAAIRCISNTLHKFPFVADLWFYLAQYFLKEAQLDSKKASIFSQKALSSGLNNADVTKMLALASIAEQCCGNLKRSLILAQKALRIYPQKIENWAALISVVLPNAKTHELNWLSHLVSKLKPTSPTNKVLDKWLNKTEDVIRKSLIVQ